MTYSSDTNQQLQQLSILLENVDCGMLTTVDDDGSLHSRPMSICGDIDRDGVLWFFTFADSHKVVEIEHCQQVNVSFAAPSQQQYVSISGTAEIVKDHHKLQEKWQPELQTWFPRGLNEPNIALLKVKINKVDYWDSRYSFNPQRINFRTLSPI